MGIRKATARAASAASTGVLKHVFRRPAGNFPGKIALYLDPQIIAEESAKLARGSVCVVGTNGKTTITNMLADCVEAAHLGVVCNRSGANLDSGVATSLLHAKPADWGVFECDELWLAKCLPQLRSRFVVLTNLFRDQLDRVGEIDRIQESIAGALAASPDTVLVYNADDPYCERIARMVSNPRIPFGMGEAFKAEIESPSATAGGGSCMSEGESSSMFRSQAAPSPQAVPRPQPVHLCQECESVLHYDYLIYDQLGSYSCSECGFGRAPLRFGARNCHVTSTGLDFDVVAATDETGVAGGVLAHIQASYTGTYMIYNLLAVYAAGYLMELPGETLQAAIGAYDPHNGRLETLQVQGRQVMLNLAKNPTGFDQNLGLLARDPAPKVAAFFVNDMEGDGRDVSWIWDIDFEQLALQQLACVFAGGARANDVQLRLKYAGIDARITDSATRVLEVARGLPDDCHVYLIANYTSLPEVRSEVVAMLEGNQASANATTAAYSPGASRAGDAAGASRAGYAAGVEGSAGESEGMASEGQPASSGTTPSAAAAVRPDAPDEGASLLPSSQLWTAPLLECPLNIVQLYGEVLNLNGDNGNVVVLQKRCAWRGIPVQVQHVAMGQAFDFALADIVVIGGGPDRAQKLAARHLADLCGSFTDYVESDGVVLAVNGGYQLLGVSWPCGSDQVSGAGILRVQSRVDETPKRVVGDIVLESQLATSPVVGYENHIARTYPVEGARLSPFGRVIGKHGCGNSEDSGADGVLYRNVVATYAHGPVLAKNPQVADWLIMRAIERRLQQVAAQSAPSSGSASATIQLPHLDDSIELAANAFMCNRLGLG